MESSLEKTRFIGGVPKATGQAVSLLFFESGVTFSFDLFENAVNILCF